MTKPLQSIGSVLAGMFVIIFLSVGTDLALASSVLPNIPLVLALIYRTAYAILGGYITAMLAPGNRMKRVWVLNVIGSILGTLGALGNWGKSDQWYPILLVIFSFIAVWGGGKLQISNTTSKTITKKKKR